MPEVLSLANSAPSISSFANYWLDAFVTPSAAMFLRWFVLTLAIFMTATAVASPLVTRAKKFKGEATYFKVGLGACGKRNKDSQPIISVNHDQFKNSACGKWIQVKNRSNGKTARGYVVDECMGCGYGDLDLSPSLFKKLGKKSQGVLKIEWSFSGKSKRQNPDEPLDKDNDPDFPEDMRLQPEDLL